MSFLLHLETATEICSVAISEDDRLITERTARDPYQHTAKITLLIEQALAEAGLSINRMAAVSVSRGPGSYTALRVGLSTAKGICFSKDIPLIAVDTLQSLALASVSPDDPPATVYIPMIDARRMEVYAAIYDRQGKVLQPVQDLILEPDSFAEYFRDGVRPVFSGNGSGKFQEIIRPQTARFRSIYCSASNLVSIAWQHYCNQTFENLAYFSPDYVKSPNITTPRKRL